MKKIKSSRRPSKSAKVRAVEAWAYRINTPDGPILCQWAMPTKNQLFDEWQPEKGWLAIPVRIVPVPVRGRGRKA